MWPALMEEFVAHRVQNTKHHPLQDYVGIYQSSDYTLKVEIYELSKAEVNKVPNPELLGFKINSAKLRHYHDDSWMFVPNSSTRKGMEGFLQSSLLIVSFVVKDSNELQGLAWDLQGGKCEGPAPALGVAVLPMRFQHRAVYPA